MAGGSKDLEKAKYWQQLLAEQKEISLSGSEFCRKRNIKPNQFLVLVCCVSKAPEGKEAEICKAYERAVCKYNATSH